jgi:putative thioredoxin
MSLIGETQAPKSPAAADLIKDGSDAGFMADVIEASKTTPVIVDFWAPWCGPCRQLGPAIERAVLAAKGKVKLVKIDIDQHPQYAGQLGVQSIPAVYAFADGRPVDRFIGALPESQVKTFVDQLAGEAAPDATDELLALAKESIELGDPGGAAQAYAQILQADPDNVKALGGMARIYLDGGDLDRAREIAGMVPPTSKDVDIDSVRAALALADAAPSETQAFEQRLAADADDHEARYELSKALAGRGAWQEAADHLLTIIERDRTWNEEAARRQLLTIFEAAGPGSDITRSGRRRLSSILFS